MLNKIKANKRLINYLSKQKTFTKSNLYNYYLSKGKKLSDNALRWRIHDFKKAGIIRSVSRGIYTFSKKPHFSPNNDSFIKKVINLYLYKYDDLDYCIWNTKWLNNFMIHQPINSFFVIETDKDITESVFYYLKDNNIKAFNNPSEQIMEEHVLGEQDAIIVKPLISRSPLLKIEKSIFPELEKILVDLFCDKHIFFIYGGQEIVSIFENAFDQYSINYSTLYAYATRRGKNNLLKDFLKKNNIND